MLIVKRRYARHVILIASAMIIVMLFSLPLAAEVATTTSDKEQQTLALNTHVVDDAGAVIDDDIAEQAGPGVPALLIPLLLSLLAVVAVSRRKH